MNRRNNYMNNFIDDEHAYDMFSYYSDKYVKRIVEIFEEADEELKQYDLRKEAERKQNERLKKKRNVKLLLKQEKLNLMTQESLSRAV